MLSARRSRKVIILSCMCVPACLPARLPACLPAILRQHGVFFLLLLITWSYNVIETRVCVCVCVCVCCSSLLPGLMT